VSAQGRCSPAGTGRVRLPGGWRHQPVRAIDDHHILQAKGHRFPTAELIGGDATSAAEFRHGSFANLYLSPRDYHRLHMPCDGVLTRMIYVPGALFSVSPTTARGVPNLFARNERVVCMLASLEHGPFVMVLVGATIVGSMATVWHGVVNPERTGKVSEWRYDQGAVVLKKGEEMGRFLLGSTVIMLFKRDVHFLQPGLGAGTAGAPW
jgi:phosphatidylserine decarboxylase